MAQPVLAMDIDGVVATVRLDRPGRRNALNETAAAASGGIRPPHREPGGPRGPAPGASRAGTPACPGLGSGRSAGSRGWGWVCMLISSWW